MEKNIRFVGLDVHAETIAASVVDPGSLVESLGTIVHRPESVRKLMRRLGHPDQLRVCYEAGPTGYGLYWLLTGMGIHCDVVAPTLIPTKSGDRVKTDRRDAEKLAKYYQHGELTPVWVPDAEHASPLAKSDPPVLVKSGPGTKRDSGSGSHPDLSLRWTD